MSYITLKNVGKKYDDNWIIKDVTFELNKGEIVAIVGPSGSGKSTLLRIVNRLIELDNGIIEINGKNIKEFDPPKLRKIIGMVFQFPAVFPGTVKENLEYGMNLWKIKNDGQLMKAIEDSGLDSSFLEKNAEKLSGGEKQRVCLARSLVIGSKALLLDEPTASLDIKSSTKVEATFTKLKEKRELAILWVTHNLEQAKRVADRVVVLEKGKLIAFCRTSEFDWGCFLE